ncbi:Rieske (2Fe-2S) protein [Kineococcus gypseus]|uniref:Rieske (2Fe-2S) protein n=1 Tax=Kineococcus gypseus TaxID=1637102 RepID=UPI003D7E4527
MDRTRRPRTPLSRRGALGAGLAGGALLAGCAPGQEEQPAAPSPTGTGTPSAPAPAPADGADPAAGTWESGTGTALTTLSAVPVGSAVVLEDGSGVPVVVAQPEAGRVVAFGARCPHQGCAVVVEGAELSCPCHYSRFESATGALLEGPATEGLTPYPVVVSGQDVLASDA